MDHEEAAELLAVHAIGATDRGEADAIDRHIAGCERCDVEMLALRATVRILDELYEGGLGRSQ